MLRTLRSSCRHRQDLRLWVQGCSGYNQGEDHKSRTWPIDALLAALPGLAAITNLADIVGKVSPEGLDSAESGLGVSGSFASRVEATMFSRRLGGEV